MNNVHRCLPTASGMPRLLQTECLDAISAYLDMRGCSTDGLELLCQDDGH